MSDIDDLIVGLTILREFGVNEVNVGREKNIFAGPDIDEVTLDPGSIVVLEDRNWRVDEEVGRWGYWL